MKKSPFKFIVIITLVIIAIIALLVVLSNSQSQKETELGEQPPIEGQPVLGDEDAPVTVVEFGDFKCPACKAWGDQVYPQLVDDYVDSGDVNFSFINVLFHGGESELASLAAESVLKQNPDVYWDFHKALFAAQPASHDEQWVTTDNILDIASGVEGIDTDELQTAIENETEIDAVEKDDNLVSKFGVELTPTIMINDIMIEDPFDYEAIKNAIESELEG